MKTIPLTALCGILLCSIGQANVPDASIDALAAEEKTPANIETRLETIQVGQFNVEDLPLSTAIQQFDDLVEPFGLQVLFQPIEGKPVPTVNLRTRNLSLHRNLSFMCRQVGYGWWVENGVIIVGQAGSNEDLETVIIPVHSVTAQRLVKTQRASK